MKKAFRIKKSSEIEAVMKAQNVSRNRYLRVYKKENHDNLHFRFALSVPKRFGNAVERNKIKRRLRMIVSQQSIKGTDDFFIVVQPNVKHLSFKELTQNLSQLLAKAKII